MELGAIVGEEPARIAPSRGRRREGCAPRRANGSRQSQARHTDPVMVVDHIEDLENDPLWRCGVVLGFMVTKPRATRTRWDGRDRRHVAPRGGHVEVDGFGPGIEALSFELLAPAHDLLLVEVGDARGRGLGAPRAGLETRRAFEAIAPEQLESQLSLTPWAAANALMGRPVRRWVSIRNRPWSIGDPFQLGLSYVLADRSARDCTYVAETLTSERAGHFRGRQVSSAETPILVRRRPM
jgi:hypothetical protein